MPIARFVVCIPLLCLLFPSRATAQSPPALAPDALVRYEVRSSSPVTGGDEMRRGEVVRVTADSLVVRTSHGTLMTAGFDRLARLEVYAGRARRDFWSGARTGGVVGGVLVGGLAVLAVASDPSFFDPPAAMVLIPTAMGVVAGGLVGGLVGKIGTIEVWEPVELSASLTPARGGMRAGVSLRY